MHVDSLNAVCGSGRQQSDTSSVGTGCHEWLCRKLGVLWSPVTIMTVECDGMLLLGRQPRFPARRYSALAGFVEPGESVEEAVAREIFEEAGVRVRDVRYVASQPWPFPSSLMIGCHGYADDPAIVIDKTELDDARWFTRAEVEYAMNDLKIGREDGAFLAPPPFAVAHHLLKWWIEQ